MRRLLAPVCAAMLATAGMAAAQIPPDVAAKLREIGPVIEGVETIKLYLPLFSAEPLKGVSVVRDQAFGADPKQILDVYKPEAGGGGRPVLIFLPGGAGVKQSRDASAPPVYDNIGAWGVRNGFVVVIAQYRFGGGAPWDAPGRDIASAIQWVKANARAHGGDPAKVAAMGQSNGAMQLANYLTLPEVRSAPPELKAVVLMGGRYNIAPLEAKAPPPRFAGRPAGAGRIPGLSGAEALERSNLEALKAQRIPVMLAAGELEPEQIVEMVQVLGDELRKAGRKPATVIVPGHSHVSEILSFGTPDQSVTRPVLEFLRASL